MKNRIEIKIRVLMMLIVALSVMSCEKDDAQETVYDFSTIAESDLTIANNTDDATKMQNMFLDKKWFTTKTISGDNIEETDAKAKAYFNEVVEQANAALAEMTFNGNYKFTYQCTRTSGTTEVEIAKQQWNYLGRTTTESKSTKK